MFTGGHFEANSEILEITNVKFQSLPNLNPPQRQKQKTPPKGLRLGRYALPYNMGPSLHGAPLEIPVSRATDLPSPKTKDKNRLRRVVKRGGDFFEVGVFTGGGGYCDVSEAALGIVVIVYSFLEF